MKTIPENIYHRVYQLVKRNIDLRIIATTLNLPLRTVLNVIARIEKSGLSEKTGFDSIKEETVRPPREPFLDSYLVPRNRYAILQLVGFLSTATKAKLDQELLVAKLSPWKILAIQLSEISVMDGVGGQTVLDFCVEMKSRDRYVAILDPPMELEPVLEELQFESKVPIFGTKWAFEEEALNHTNSIGMLNTRNRGAR